PLLLRRLLRGGRLARRGTPGLAGGAQELLHFVGAQLADGADRQPRVTQGADGDAAQLLHGVADAEEHLADLARPPLGQLDPPPGVVAVVVVAPTAALGGERPAVRRDAAGGGALPFEHDAGAEAVERFVRRPPLDLDLVGLGRAVAR